MAEKLTISPHRETTSASANETILNAREIQPENIYKRLPIQRKLSIGAVDDPLEDEADAMADKVMRMPEQKFIQRNCAHCEEEEKAQRKPLASFIQKKQSSFNNSVVASDSVSNQIQSTKGSGNAMHETTKSFMESRFGTDFSNVNIHTGNDASQLSNQLNAQAFTVGNDIYFNEGKYVPESKEGKQLLAHELAHVVQQIGGSGRPAPEVDPSAPHEQDAHAAAVSVGMGFQNIRVTCSTGVGLARATPPGEPPQLSREEVEAIKRHINLLGNEFQKGLDKAALELLEKEGVEIPSEISKRAKRNLIRGWLQGIASDPRSPRQAQAGNLLRDIESNLGEIRNLNREIGNIDQARRAAENAATWDQLASRRRFASAVAKEESAGAKAKSATAKSEGAIAKVEDVAVQGERATAELGVSAAKEAGFAAKVGNVLEAGLPGPQDVLFLFISFFGSLAEAKAKLSEEAYSEGFARGAAAKLLGMEADWVPDNLIRPSFGGSTGEQIAGFEGVKEHGVSQGAVDGYVFARRFTQQQIVALRRYGYAAMLLFTGARFDRHGDRRNVHDDRHNVIVLGHALKTKLEDMLEEAQEAARVQEAERLRAEYAEEIRSGRRTSIKGHGWAQP